MHTSHKNWRAADVQEPQGFGTVGASTSPGAACPRGTARAGAAGIFITAANGLDTSGAAPHKHGEGFGWSP